MLTLAFGKARTGAALGNLVLTTEGSVTLIDAYLGSRNQRNGNVRQKSSAPGEAMRVDAIAAKGRLGAIAGGRLLTLFESSVFGSPSQ